MIKISLHKHLSPIGRMSQCSTHRKTAYTQTIIRVQVNTTKRHHKHPFHLECINLGYTPGNNIHKSERYNCIDLEDQNFIQKANQKREKDSSRMGD